MAQHIMIGTLVVMVSLLGVSHAALTWATVCAGAPSDCAGDFICGVPAGCTKGYCICPSARYRSVDTAGTTDSCLSTPTIAEGDMCDPATPENGVCDLAHMCNVCAEDSTSFPLTYKCMSRGRSADQAADCEWVGILRCIIKLLFKKGTNTIQL